MQLHPMLLRFQARRALKGHWQTALVAAFIAGIFNTVYQVALQLNLRQLIALVNTLVNQGYPLEYIATRIDWSLFVLPGVLYLLSLILTPALQMGLKHYYMLRLSAVEAGFTAIFSHLFIFMKAFLLELLVTFKILLWALTGMALLTAVVFFSPNLPPSAIEPLIWLATLLAVLPAIIAAYRYMLASFAMAEDPNIGAFQAVRLSKGWMKNHKAALFMTQLGFFGWIALSSMASSLLSATIGSVLTIAFELFANLILSVYMMATYTAFYLARRGHEAQQEPSQP